MSESQEYDAVYVLYDETRRGGDAVDPTEEWSNRKDQQIEFRVIAIQTHEPHGQPYHKILRLDEPVKKNEPLHLVIVRFDSGDTFGRSYGNWHIEGGYADKRDADTVSGEIMDGKYPEDPPWSGYFNRVDHVEVVSMPVY